MCEQPPEATQQCAVCVDTVHNLLDKSCCKACREVHTTQTRAVRRMSACSRKCKLIGMFLRDMLYYMPLFKPRQRERGISIYLCNSSKEHIAGFSFYYQRTGINISLILRTHFFVYSYLANNHWSLYNSLWYTRYCWRCSHCALANNIY